MRILVSVLACWCLTLTPALCVAAQDDTWVPLADGGLAVPTPWGAVQQPWDDDGFWIADAGNGEVLDRAETPDAGVAPSADAGPQAAPLPRWRVRRFTLRLDHPRVGERERLKEYAGVRPGDLMTHDDVQAVEERLLRLGVFRTVTCAAHGAQRWGLDVACGAVTARLIRSWTVEGLPLRVLRKEFDRQVFLRPGQRLDALDARTGSRVASQRRRIERFLRQEGFFGTVSVDTQQVKKDPRSVDVVIRLGALRTVKMGTIKVQGLPRHAVGEAVSFVRDWPWDSYRPVRTRERIETLTRRWRHRQHPEARISMEEKLDVPRGRVDLVVHAHLGPVIRFHVDNRSVVETDVLLKSLTMWESGVTDDTEVAQSVIAMTEVLQQQGLVDAHVTAERVPEGIVFHVVGSVTGVVRSVRISGLTALPESLVRKQAGLALQPQGLLLVKARPPVLETPWVVGSQGTFTQQDMLDDVQRLQTFLRRQGYPEADVVPRADVSAGDGSVDVHFHVTPGQRFVVKEVRFQGAKAYSVAELRKTAGIWSGRPFDPNALEEYQARLISFYSRQGYLKTEVQALLDFTADGGTILNFAITEGPRSRLAGIFLQGNTRTWDRVVLRELDLEPGAPLDPVEIDAALARLRRTGAFSHVGARWVGLAEGRQNVWLVVLLEERANRTLDGSLAFSTAEYLSVGVEARDRNVAGSTVDMTLRAQFGPLIAASLAAPQLGYNIDAPQMLQNLLGAQVGIRSRNRVGGALRLPHLWGTPMNLVGNLNAEARDRPIPAAVTNESALNLSSVDVAGLALPVPWNPLRKRSYDQERYAQAIARVGLELPVWGAVTTSMTYGYEAYMRQLVDSPNEAWDPGLPTRAGWLEASIGLNLLDNPFDPRKGVLLSGRIKGGSRLLLGEGEFVVTSGQAAAYYSYERLTVGGSLRGTVAVVDGAAGNKRVVPRRDLGLAGGDRSVRGYDEDAIRVRRKTLRAGVSPQDPRSVVNEPGLYSWVANAEARLLLFRNVGIGDVQLAGFVDAAQVTDRLPPWSVDLVNRPTEVGLGTGVGIRYVTPVGPLALDYGVDVLHAPRGRLHIQFGYTF